MNTFADSNVLSLKVGIIGDSTVFDYPTADRLRGWGQELPAFFSREVRFLNLARCGASTKTFPADQWQKILEYRADFVLIQFGHNDQHAKHKPEATDAATDYKDHLRRYMKESRDSGAVPILVTPMHRRTFEPTTHRLTTELEPYADAMKDIGRELNVLVVDLYRISGELYESLGEEASMPFTANHLDQADRPGHGDRSHFTPYGAREMARLVAEGLAAVEPRLRSARIGQGDAVLPHKESK